MSPLTGPKAPSQLHGLALVRMCSQECDSRPLKTERRRPQSIVWASLAFKVALLLTLAHASLPFSAFATCTAPKIQIEAENCLPGTPPSQWYIPGAGSPNIQGFAADISVNAGQTIFFKVSTNATSYRIDVYRLGYYQGQGARLVASVLPSALLPQVQAPCLTDSSTGLIDCGNWAVSASWAVPSTATSGLYFAVLTRLDTGDQSPIVFVVRNDSSHSNILVQTSDLNWQAYNQYGGNSLYEGSPAGRAYKVSYNRPIVANPNAWPFDAEYPMLRWLEANGYDLSYFDGVDTDRNGPLITQHKVFMSVGHDEYWSGGQRANVEAARAAGVHLAFFSGNEVFWKTRWENGLGADGAPYRTLVSYKESHPGTRLDPLDPNVWTGSWRDPRYSVAPTLDGLPVADGGRPENGLTGTIFTVNSVPNQIAGISMMVPLDDGKMRFWRNTNLATLSATDPLRPVPAGTLCYEFDEDLDNGTRPAGLFHLSTTALPTTEHS